ncbi:DUF6587 family protein [Pandoraea pnomenusa]|uniref:Uncharacterized protein n=1 Tax=Pandoraea pnomenusa TaxID=93220 RepID=A0A378YS05_9BURK|nr:DUF6587 family protein [Pandoraea pnomenusa]MBN9094846.1 hypothetical protein [Pandoraea pnomenusa]SUA79942.1 Uncharacterised protein [Pandoraea pnomenusa]
MSPAVQYVVVAVIVVASALSVLRHLLPRQTRAVGRRLFDALARRGVPVPRKWRQAPAPASGCASGCGGCSTSQCATPERTSTVTVHRDVAGRAKTERTVDSARHRPPSG